MNGNKKLHKPIGPAFNAGEVWFDSSGNKATVISVSKYPGAKTDHISDYGVVYVQSDGVEHENDAWNFQARYVHIADKDI